MTQGPMSLLRRVRGELGRGALLTTMTTYLGMGLSVVSSPLIAHTLGADGRGVLAGSFAFTQILSSIAFFSLPTVLAREARRTRRISRQGFGWLTGLGVFNALMAFCAADLVSNGDPRMALGIRGAALTLLIAGFCDFGVQAALANSRLGLFNLIRVGYSVLPSLIIIAAYFAGTLTLQVAYLAMLAGQVFTAVTGTVVFLVLTKVSGSERVLWKEPLQLWSAKALDNVSDLLGQVLLGALAVPAELGVFAVGVTLASAAAALAQATTAASYSKFLAHAERGDLTPARSVWRLTILGVVSTAAAGGAILVALALFGEMLFGPTFSGLTGITALLLIARICNDQWNLRVTHDTAHSDTGMLAPASIAGTLLAILCVVAVSLFGMLSAATMALSLCAGMAARLAMRALVVRRDRTPVRRPNAR